MRSQRVIFIAIIFSITLVSCYLGWWWYLAWGSKPARSEIPAIRNYVARYLEGVSVEKVIDVSSWDEAEVYLTLYINGKGRLTLKNATLSSFTGGGRLLLETIDDCVVSPVKNLSIRPTKDNFPEIYATSVIELIDRYDDILRFLEKNAHHNPSASIPGCWR